MPNADELKQLDALVRTTAPPSSTVRPVPAPDREEKVGDTKRVSSPISLQTKEPNGPS